MNIYAKEKTNRMLMGWEVPASWFQALNAMFIIFLGTSVASYWAIRKLKGKVSTTFPSDINTMRKMFPELDIRKDVLFVHDGKYITSAGGAKSFEAALYLCEFLYGKEVAKSLAGGLVIDWNVDTVPHLVVK